KAAPARFESEFREHIHEPIPMDYWEAQYDDLDAMILVAHQDKDMLVDKDKNPQIADNTLRELIAAFKDYVVAVEFGHVMYNDPKKTEIVEHFGFRDGISKPIFFTSDKKKQEDKGLEAHPLYNGGYSSVAPLDLVLVPDPNTRPGDHAYGSYLVFAKLEQDVK